MAARARCRIRHQQRQSGRLGRVRRRPADSLARTARGLEELEPVLPSPASPEAAATAGESDCVQGAVTWYGIFDFAAIPPSQLVTPATPGSLPSAVVRY